jgi:hypothetical protein
VWNDSQTAPRENGQSHAFRLHDRDGHAPIGRRFAAEKWVMRTEALGSAKEAHRRWPEGRSEQGASKAKVEPSQVSNRAAARFWLWRLNFSCQLGGVSKFKKCNFILNSSMDEASGVYIMGT